MSSRLKWTIPIYAYLCLTTITTAQNRSADSREPLRVDVRLVNITATVTDENGRYAAGLSADDFLVEEDGVIQEIAHFTQDRDIPVSVGIVLDTSGSMERKIRTAVDAVDTFIRTIHPDDDIFLMTFAGEPVLRQDFTSDRTRLSRALRSLRLAGGTALYDALDEGLQKIRSGRHDKRAILLISDGEDTSSQIGFNEALRVVRESELLVYALGIAPATFGERTDHVPFTWPPSTLPGRRRIPNRNQRDAVDMTVLNSFADHSGGRAFLLSDTWVGRGSQIEKVLTQVADELRSQYTLGYYPKTSEDGRFHSIKVRTRRGHVVRTRTGYVAGS
jgi:Ca-activated chloride channel family protein